MRTLLLATAAVIATIAVLALSDPHRYTAPALACTPPPPSTLEAHVKDAAFIGVVEASSVGDGVNHVPTATPTSTTTPLATPSVTRTATASAATPPSSETAVVVPALPPADVRLVGRGATVTVTQGIYGASSGSLEIDRAARSSLEQRIREDEELRQSGSFATCGPGQLPEYHAGHRYLLVADVHEGALYTVARFVIDGADGLVEDAAHAGWNSLLVRQATHLRYLAEVPAEQQEYREGEFSARITADRLPLDRLSALLLAMRSGVVLPPDTGNAGLAANR